ncbi:hypothetical protein BKA70DRAFT_1482680 [Coprinopsis sp. MPI-PUGE-AT-0042]|nr:hypothetical protein BKA70DRAFT_1482680 [Coprinopsis sp. MPI-PUGE-AT-0042]
MFSDAQLRIYADSNEPLPEYLNERLKRFLDSLDTQGELYEHEGKRIGEAIASRRAMINALEKGIEALLRVQNGLREGKKVLDRKMHRYAITVAARRHIPPEVIAKVIQFAIEGPDGWMYLEQRLSFATMRSVCHLWRETSFSTPSLWRTAGLDMSQIINENPLVEIRTYIWGNLTTWFRRVGKGAPVGLHVYGSLPTTISDIMDFAWGTSFNLATITFSGGRIDRVTEPSYSTMTSLASSSGGSLQVKHLGIEFQHDNAYQPSGGNVVNLARTFLQLATLSLAEFASPCFRFPLIIVHPTLTLLYLDKLVLGSQEIFAVLSGLPQLRSLHLEGCEGRVDRNSHTPYTHSSLEALVMTDTISQACLGALTCPALDSVAIAGTPPLRLRPNKGRILGQFLQRCGNVTRFYVHGSWPANLLENVLNGNTVLASIVVDFFSCLCVLHDSTSRFIQIPLSTSFIVIVERATQSQLAEFLNRITLPEAKTLLIYVPQCRPPDVAYFPWPRPGNGRDYYLCSIRDLE